MWTLTGCKHFGRVPLPILIILYSISDDPAAHIAEEVSGAAKAAPITVLVSVAATVSLGWLTLIAVYLLRLLWLIYC